MTTSSAPRRDPHEAQPELKNFWCVLHKSGGRVRAGVPPPAATLGPAVAAAGRQRKISSARTRPSSVSLIGYGRPALLIPALVEPDDELWSSPLSFDSRLRGDATAAESRRSRAVRGPWRHHAPLYYDRWDCGGSKERTVMAPPQF